MKDSLTRSILAFETRTGSNGAQTQHLIHDLRRDFDGYPYAGDRYLKQRTAYVAEQIGNYFGQTQLHFSPLDNGHESLVLDCHNDHILKMRWGIQHRQSNIPPNILLQPVVQHYHPDMHISFELFPKAKTGLATSSHIRALKQKCLRQGYYFFDAIPQNVGFIKHAHQSNPHQKDQAVIIDSGAVYSLKHPALYYRLAQRMAAPLYAHMPLLHPLWRIFKQTAKNMIHRHMREKAPLQQPSIRNEIA